MEYWYPNGVGITWRKNVSHSHADGEVEVGALHPDIEILQYTGLRDRNGKEIYEGDILNLFPDSSVGMFPESWAKVIWENARFYLHKLDDRKTFFLFSEEVTPKYEVVGNIFENSEVLENLAV